MFAIDHLLRALVIQKATDLHIMVGQPPMLRLGGRMRRLKTDALGPEDTVSLMKAITPTRCEQELQDLGWTEFGYAFGDNAQFRVSVFKQRAYVAMVLSLCEP